MSFKELLEKKKAQQVGVTYVGSTQDWAVVDQPAIQPTESKFSKLLAAKKSWVPLPTAQSSALERTREIYSWQEPTDQYAAAVSRFKAPEISTPSIWDTAREAANKAWIVLPQDSKDRAMFKADQTFIGSGLDKPIWVPQIAWTTPQRSYAPAKRPWEALVAPVTDAWQAVVNRQIQYQIDDNQRRLDEYNRKKWIVGNAVMLWTLPVVGAAPIAALGWLAAYDALSRIESGVIKATQWENPFTWERKEISSLLREDTPLWVRAVVDVLDFVGKGLALHWMYKSAPKVADKFTKDIITQYKLPQTVRVKASDVWDWQTGKNKIDPKLDEQLSSLNMSAAERSSAARNGISINIPAEIIVKQVDKPYWAKLKSVIGKEPFEREVSRGSDWSVAKAPAGLLPWARFGETVGAPVANLETSRPVVEPKLITEKSNFTKALNNIKSAGNRDTQSNSTKTNSLLIQAQKFIQDGKSVDDFVGAYQKLLHGTSKNFDKFDISKSGDVQPSDWGAGAYFTDNIDHAKSFAKVAGGDVVLERYAPDVKYADWAKLLKDSDFMNALDDGMGFTSPWEYLAEKWYGGVKFKNPQGFTEYVIFDAKNIKTKQQLIDIYNRANQSSKHGKSVPTTKPQESYIRTEDVGTIKEKTPEERRVETLAKIRELWNKRRLEASAKVVEEKKSFKEALKKKKEAKKIAPDVEKLKEETANKLAEDYNKIANSEEIPTEAEMKKMDDLSSKYEKLTGKTIEEHVRGASTTSIDSASMVREDLYEPEYGQSWSIMYSKKAPRVSIGWEKWRYTEIDAEKIRRIESWTEKFSVAEENVRIVRKYKALLMANTKWSEGHLINNIIGHDSVINPLLLAHELAHLVAREGSYVLRIANDPIANAEMQKLYKRYYPGARSTKNKPTVALMLNEGLAEFMRRALFDYARTKKEFPYITENILNGWSLHNQQLADLYNDFNNVIATYQALSPIKRAASKSIIDFDFKKIPVKSSIIGKLGNTITYTQDSIYPMDIIDRLTNQNRSNPNNNFSIDNTTGSAALYARTKNAMANLALSNIDETSDAAFIINEKWDQEKILNFWIGKLIKEVHDSWDLTDYTAYLKARDFKRDRLKLEKLEEEYQKRKDELEDSLKEENNSKLEQKVKRLKQEVKRYRNIVEAWKMDTPIEAQEKIISDNTERFSKYDDRLAEVFKAHLKIKVRSWVMSQKNADSLLSTPGYAPSFRQQVSDIERFTTGSQKRSSVSWEMRARKGSNKPIISPMAVLAKMHISGLMQFNEQMLYNTLHEKWMKLGIIQEIWKGATSEPWKYVYAKNWKLTTYNILDGTVALSIEANYGRKTHLNVITKYLDAAFHGTARVFQKTTTTWNPYFAFGKNIFLDIPSSFIFSKTWYIPFVSQFSRYAKDVVSKTAKESHRKYIDEYNRAGGSNSSISEISFDQKNPMDVIKKVANNKSKIRVWLESVWGVLSKIMSSTEVFTRREEYIRAREQGASFAEAMEKANNVSGSFHRSWAYARHVVRYLAFLNSGIQIAYQMVKSTTQKESAKRFAIATVLSSAIAVASMMHKIDEIDNATTEDEKEKAINDAFKYLDKSSYEKLNYYALGNNLELWKAPLKFASNPILAAPGNYISLLMLQNRLPEYKINWTELVYQTVSSILPNQVVPDISSADNFTASVAWKIVGSTPITNTVLNFAGYKTFPWLQPIENAWDLKWAANTRYREDTNNLAIFLGQYLDWTGLSPLRIEQMIRSLISTWWSAASDLIGAELLALQDQPVADIKQKTLKELLLTWPTKSSTAQQTRNLRWETASKLYNKIDETDSDMQSLSRRAKDLLQKSKVKDEASLPTEKKREFATMQAQYDRLDKLSKELETVRRATVVLTKYEAMGKKTRNDYANSLNRYILSLDSKRVDQDKLPQDFRNIEEMARMYQDLGKIDWSTVK